MLSVTQSAVEQLAGMLEATESDQHECLRLTHQGEGRLGLTVDGMQEGDQVVGDRGRPVLFIEPELSDSLDGATLDVVDGLEGAQLTLIRPGDGPAQ
jgi:Fe-S cluster assembly iron-binding protein IscA